MISIEIDEEPDPKWNDRLLGSQFGTIYQTKEHGAYVKSRLKSKPVYLKFYTNNGEIVSQLLLYQSFKGRGKLAKYFGRGFVYSAFARASFLMPKYVNWIFGPVIFNNSYQNEVSDSLGNLLTEWKVEFQGTSHPLNIDFNFSQKFNFQKRDAGTFLIDLNQSADDIINKTDKKSVKKNIERAQERKVTITEISSKEDLIRYHELLNRHRLEGGLSSYSLEDVIEGYEKLKPVGQTGFLAWHDKIPIGGILLSSFNNYINEWGIARSKTDTEKKLYSLDLLRWKIIEWGVRNKCRYYDLSGIKPENRSPKEEALYINKAKWGGKLITYSNFSNRP